MTTVMIKTNDPLSDKLKVGSCRELPLPRQVQIAIGASLHKASDGSRSVLVIIGTTQAPTPTPPRTCSGVLINSAPQKL